MTYFRCHIQNEDGVSHILDGQTFYMHLVHDYK